MPCQILNRSEGYFKKKMDANQELINDMSKGATDLNKNISDVNQDLKNIVKKMRTPGKLCMDITLLIILAVLTGTLIWAIRQYMSMEV